MEAPFHMRVYYLIISSIDCLCRSNIILIIIIIKVEIFLIIYGFICKFIIYTKG